MGGERYTTGLIRDGAGDREGRIGAPDATRLSVPESDLAARFWDRIRTFAARRLRDSAAAEDVAQETLRRVVEALRDGRIENLEALPAFVFQTARHICLQADRSSLREARALSRLAEPGNHPAPDALVALINEERCSAVRRALDGLVQGDRTLLRQIYYERLNPSLIAQQLGVTAGALRVRKHRALLRLSERLGRHDQ
jgi:RNA polymerase sigma-70 factor (ECF subfamily)